MARLVGLNTNQPHVGIAEFAARMGNYSSAWKYLKWSHDSLTAKVAFRASKELKEGDLIGAAVTYARIG